MNSTTGNLTHGEVTPYDDVGAMQYILVVILVYGVAVIGVFVLSYFGRRKHVRIEMDKQATTYIRSMRIMRGRLEMKHRLDSVKSLLASKGEFNHNCSVSGVVGNGMFAFMALPFIAAGPGTSVSEPVNCDIEKGVPEYSSNNDSGNTLSDGNTLDVLHEVDDECDGDDDVFMNDEGVNKYGVDFYIQHNKSDVKDICI